MSENIFSKVKDWVMGDEEEYTTEEYEYEEYDKVVEEPEVVEQQQQPKATKRFNNNVVNLHTTNVMKIVVHEPLKYDEAPAIINDLKIRKTVVVNLEQLDPDTKKRIFDFINGGLYSLEGNIQKVTKDIFVLAPDTVEIDGLKDELKNKGIFSW